MKYFNLNNPNYTISFKEATIAGQATDKGLFFPENIPTLSSNFIKNIKQYSNESIANTVLQPFVENDIPKNILEKIIDKTINFPFPLQQVNKDIFSLELFHGDTLAFKDVGAKFISNCLGYFFQSTQKKITVLVATSGDTGGAVANGFLGVDGVNVIILYPSKKVSTVQEMQLTRLGKNICAVEVEGTFDDCQTIVKTAFADNDITKHHQLTSANSINIARWLPQQLYYFFAYKNWQHNEPPIVSVPSGNFGNICAGMLAYKMGLPIKKFIAACNKNDVVTNYLQTQQYTPKPAVATISNAMDVGNPSNFVRVMQLFNNSFDDIKNMLYSVSVDDTTTKQTIAEVYKKYNYILEPHGAVAYYALQQYLQENKTDKGIFLATAHPVKFPEVVEEIIEQKIDIPNNIQQLLQNPKQSVLMSNKYKDFKDWFLRTN